MIRLILGCAAFLLAAVQATAQQTPSTASATGRPSLVVLITIDQMRPDYLDRFGAQLHGGLARLKNGGALFTNAYHDHAITETAPGHATLLSGRFPRSTGISANSSGVLDSSAALIGSPNIPGASPRRFKGTTLVDWLAAGDKRTRALSVSMKDRAAILPIGRSQQSIYWYVPDGRFTTSRYYADTLPTWVQKFNARHLAQGYAGKSWSLLLPAGEYKEVDSVDFEGAGKDFVFPHLLPADSTAPSLVRVTPFMDNITAALAIDGVQHLGLGKGPQTDVLAMSLSATDLIGHRYGPDSREMHDNILELDRTLGVFLDSLYKLRDSSRIAVVLTADHGIGSIPEIAGRTVQPLPERVDLYSALQPIRMALVPKKLDRAIGLDGDVLVVDRAAFKAAHVNADSVIKVFADAARKIPGVARVDNLKALVADTLKDPIARRWTHQFAPGDPVELVVTLTPYSIGNPALVATHGSPYDYDSHVPLIFYGPWFRSGRYEDAVRTVDIAATLATVAGVKPTERLDGVVLTRALK